MKKIAIYILTGLSLWACQPKQHTLETDENTPKDASSELASAPENIPPLINSQGDTLVTGRPVRAQGRVIPLDSLPAPKVIPLLKEPQVIPLNNNSYPAVDSMRVKVEERILSAGNQTSHLSVLINSKGDTIPSGIPITAQGKKNPLERSRPIEADPLRFKDGASYNVQYLALEQGLSSSYGTDLLQDNKGNLWIGTDGSGVNQYDGTFVTQYKDHLSFHQGSSILEDQQDNLWFGSQKGLYRYDGHHLTYFSDEQGLAIEEIDHLYEDREGRIWILTWDHLLSYDGNAFIHYTAREGIPEIINCITQDRKGNIWLGTGYGKLIRWDGDTFTELEPGTGSDMALNALWEDQSGDLWGGLEGKIFRYDGEYFHYYTFGESEFKNWVNSISEDDKGELWFGTVGNGIFQFDGRTFTHFNQKQGLTSLETRKIYLDQGQNLWINTYGGGVNKYQKNSFVYFHQEQGLLSNSVNTIIEDREGNIWLGTHHGGLTRYDGTSFTHYTPEEGLPSTSIHGLCEDREGDIWFGLGGAGLARFDGKSFQVYGSGEDFSMMVISSILEDQAGHMWFTTIGQGLFKFDGLSFTHFTQKNGLADDVIWQIFEDKTGNLWLANDSRGLSKFDGQSFTHYTEKEGLSSNAVLSIAEDAQGHLWIGTRGGGLNKFDGQSFTHYTKKEGLSDDRIWTITPDHLDNLWLGTERGLNYLLKGKTPGHQTQVKSPVIIPFGQNEGLKTLYVWGNSELRDRQNRIWWGSADGLTMLDMKQFDLSVAQAQAQLNHIEIGGNFQDFRHLPEELAQKISFQEIPAFTNYPIGLELPYTLNQLGFYFSAPDIHLSGQTKYSYRLLGLDKQWAAPTSEPKVVYRNLDYGHYTFQVRAMNMLQAWGDTFSYSFTIHPPWWHTWWAWSLYALLLISTIILIVRIRTRGLKNRQKELEETVKNRTLELQESNEELVQLNEELHQKSEEITAQRDSLEEALQKLKAAQAQLIQSEKMSSLGQLTAGIAHEINNPVNFISSNIDSLKTNIEDIMAVLNEYNTIDKSNFEEKLKNIDQLKKDHEFDLAIEELDQLIQGISEGATRTTQIIQGLRTFSRLDEDVLKMTDIHKNIDATLTLLQNRYKDRIEIIKDYGDIPEIEAYPGKLNQVFMNLLSNAIEAIEGEGVISIQTCLIGGEEWGAGSEVLDGKAQENTGSHLTAHSSLLITISDSGSGMSEAVKQRIFEPFFTTKDVGKGIGLGLSIVHSIVEKHQGSIEVESRLGEGTEFRIFIPLWLNEQNTSLS